jgi:hypothetical protein
VCCNGFHDHNSAAFHGISSDQDGTDATPEQVSGKTEPRPLATTEEVAAYLRKTPQALGTMRYLGTGPKFKKLGSRVYYDWVDVFAWIESNTRQRTDDRPQRD